MFFYPRHRFSSGHLSESGCHKSSIFAIQVIHSHPTFSPKSSSWTIRSKLRRSARRSWAFPHSTSSRHTGLHWWTIQLRYVLRSGGIANLPSKSKENKKGWLHQSFLGVLDTCWLHTVEHGLVGTNLSCPNWQAFCSNSATVTHCPAPEKSN